MVAGTGDTDVDICFTVSSRESWIAGTVVVVHSVNASTVDAWIGLTLIDICLAVGSCPSRSADAGVLIGTVDALSVVHARLRFALVYINIAVYACVPWWTEALVSSWQVLARADDAWIGQTFVDFGFAAISGITKFATTFVFVVQLFAFTVNAWVGSTLSQHLVTLRSNESSVTDALVGIQLVHTSSIYTWV